ncbi:ribosomal protein 63, mitochondrial-like [Pomacea canaliculata]|uniref:ribosomal protein 63, mitochondrial-like n=1 Tax=Pomacea canaliculata TaxID=400727 RepID=UPI000D73EAF6|nr:ribosomal protein 63, mitochondrial-like [Pomacea canaliculata]
MFLTKTLQLYKRYRRVPGLLFAGKNRAYPYISVSLKRQALRWLLLEQDNVELLAKPYLTREESEGHTKAFKQLTNSPSFIQIKSEESAAKMLPHKFTSDLLNHIERGNKWE